MSAATEVELERIRMAVAEAGFDPSGVDADRFDSVAVPPRVMWRARNLVRPPICFRCFDAVAWVSDEEGARLRGTCVALVGGVEDCGAAS